MSNADTYLDPSVATTHSFNTEVEPLVHGDRYFRSIREWIEKTRGRPAGEAPDAVYIVGFQLNPELDLDLGTIKDKRLPIGALLVSRALLGVDVRIIYNGNLIIPHIKKRIFRNNLEAAEKLRSFIPSGASSPPLAGRVLYDWSGAHLTGSNHQKATVIKVGTELIAFVGGMDMHEDHWDSIAHQKKWPDNTPWGWHDIGVRLKGEAARAVWENFRLRWTEARTLHPRVYRFRPADETEEPRPFNPLPVVSSPGNAPSPSPPVTSRQSVQILRSRFPWKYRGQDRWDNEPNGGFIEVFLALKKAIAAAKRYIYFEDQFLKDEGSLEHIPAVFSPYQYVAFAIKANPNLKVIFVGSGKSDPIDFFAGPRNRELTPSIMQVIESVRPPKHPVDLSSNVVCWKFENVTVHSKLTLIDDVFAAIGSANLMSRSMYGVDSELHTAIVDDDETTPVPVVRKLRMDLWAELFNVNIDRPEQRTALETLDTALGFWRPGWYAPDPTLWHTPNNPAGFDPQSRRVKLVGP